MGRHFPPALRISSAAVKIVPSSLGCASAVLAAIAMLAPSLAALSAMESPIPREAPVMKSLPLQVSHLLEFEWLKVLHNPESLITLKL